MLTWQIRVSSPYGLLLKVTQAGHSGNGNLWMDVASLTMQILVTFCQDRDWIILILSIILPVICNNLQIQKSDYSSWTLLRLVKYQLSTQYITEIWEVGFLWWFLKVCAGVLEANQQAGSSSIEVDMIMQSMLYTWLGKSRRYHKNKKLAVIFIVAL